MKKLIFSLFLLLSSLLIIIPSNTFAQGTVLYVADNTYDIWFDAFSYNGINYVRSDTIPNNLYTYSLVAVDRYDACDTGAANYIKNYVWNGGGVMLVGATPAALCGSKGSHSDNPSSIAAWFLVPP